MNVLVFHIGSDRYALPLASVKRVLPLAELKQLPLLPDWVAGLMDLHGEPLPVIDLSARAGHAHAQPCFDSRILLVDFSLGDGRTRLLGLRAEHVTGIENVDQAALGPSGMRTEAFLGDVTSTPDGILQLVEPAALLGDEVRALLFAQAEAA